MSQNPFRKLSAWADILAPVLFAGIIAMTGILKLIIQGKE